MNLEQSFPWLFPKRNYKIDLVYDDASTEEEDEGERSARDDTINTAREISKALEKRGLEVTLIPVAENNLKTIVARLTGDLVFNMVEEDELGYEILKLLEAIKKPVTGVDSNGFELSWQKQKIKDILLENKIPTPAYFVIGPEEAIEVKKMDYPMFLKAANDHGSLSINRYSLVLSKEAFIKQVEWVRDKCGGEVLVEEYIDGRELGVTVLGNGKELVVLPPKEITFETNNQNIPKFVTYDSKWLESSEDYQSSKTMFCPARLSESEQKVVEEAAINCSRVLKVRDYARFDMRLKDGVPYIVDYNANPSLSYEGASRWPAEVFGLTYPRFLTAIVAVAMRRYSHF